MVQRRAGTKMNSVSKPGMGAALVAFLVID